jgi:lipopolysaccharide export system permease protein
LIVTRMKRQIRILPLDTLQRYVTREYLLSFTVSFLFFIAIFFVNQILVIARDRLAEQVSVIDTLRLILYAMPAIVALSVPFASFIGIILAIGKLSEGREILAARASGVSFRRLLLPVLGASLVLTSGSFFTNDYFLPLGTMNYGRLYQELLYSNSRLIIEPYSIRKYENSTLVTGNVDEQFIDGLLILDSAEDGSERTINASRAELLRNDRTAGIITLQLSEVEVITFGEDVIQESRSDVMDYNILLENIVFNVSNTSVREMSARDVWALVQTREEQYQSRKESEYRSFLTQQGLFQSQYWALTEEHSEIRLSAADRAFRQLPTDPRLQTGDRTLRLYRIEFWKKFAIPLACLTFIFIGFPLGLMARNSGRTLGIVLGLILSSAYWGMLSAIDAVGLRLISVPAALITFSPNLLMLGAGGLLLRGYFRK